MQGGYEHFGFVYNFCDPEISKECAPKAVIDQLKKAIIRMVWWYPTKKYYPENYGNDTMKDVLKRKELTFSPYSAI